MHLRPFFIILLCLLLLPTSQASTLFSSADLLRNPANSSGQLSPNGEHFSYIRFADKTTYIDLVDLATGTKRQILRSNKKHPLRHYKWLNDSTLLLYTQNSRQYIYAFDAVPETAVEAEMESDTAAEAETESDTVAEAETESDTESSIETEANVQIEGKAEATIDIETEAKVEDEAEVEVNTKADVDAKEPKNGTFTRLNSGYVVDTLDDSPQHILYAHKNTSSKGIKSGLYRINIVDLTSASFNKETLIDRPSPDLIRYIYDASFERIIGVFYDEGSKQVEMRYREYAGGEWQKIITFKEQKYTLMPIGFIDQNHVGVLTNKDTDKVVLQVFDIEQQKLGDILYQHDKYDLTDAWIGASGAALAVEYFQGGAPQKEWLSNEQVNWDDALKSHFAPNIPFVVNIDVAKQRALIFVTSATLPGQYHMYDATNDTSSKLLSLYPDLDDTRFSKTKSFKVKVQDDVQIEAYLTQANGIDHNALIVMPHGGPVGVREDNLFRPDVQMLANRGFSILRINFRGSSGYGKAFQEQGVGQFGKQIEADISAVVEHVLKQQNYEHVCAMGSSYGAYSSVMLASEHPTLYDCIVAGFGIYDLPLLFNASNYRSGEDFGEYIAEVVGENTADKVDVSPVYYAEKVQAPILIIAGKKDRIAGFEQSNRMRYMLERNDKNVEHYFYENSGHGHSNYLLDRHELALTVDFLYRQLGISIDAPDTSSKEDMEVIAQDFMFIADGYDNDKMRPIDPEKNAEYLSKAKEYNDPRAFFNLGAHHARGDVLTFDRLKARQYYEKSAVLGYKNAHRRLANSYLAASIGISESYPADEEKALFHLNAAVEHNPDAVNQKQLAYFYCVASPAHQDVDKCLAGFLESLGDSTFYDGMRDEFAMAVLDGTYTQSQKDQMTAFAEKWFGLSHISFEADIADVGIFEFELSNKFGRHGEYELTDATSLSQVSAQMAEKRIALGVRFVPDTEGIPYQKDRTLALIEWLEKDAQNVLIRRDFVTIKRAPSGDWIRYFTVHSVPPGTTYTLNIYSVDGKLNYTKTFSE